VKNSDIAGVVDGGEVGLTVEIKIGTANCGERPAKLIATPAKASVSSLKVNCLFVPVLV
jgi:hypothetical protein